MLLVLLIFRMERVTECDYGNFAQAASTSSAVENILHPCTINDRLSFGWQKTFVPNANNPLLLDLVFYSPDFQSFASLKAAQKFDRTRRGDWGHNLSAAASEGRHGGHSEQAKSETFKKDIYLYDEKLLTVSRFGISDSFRNQKFPGHRKFTLLFSIAHFENTQFSKLFSEPDRKTSVDIIAWLQVMYIIKKKLRMLDRRWHYFVGEIEKQSDFLLYNECA